MYLIITVYVLGDLVAQAGVSVQDQPKVVVQAGVSAHGLEASRKERGKHLCKLENYYP